MKRILLLPLLLISSFGIGQEPTIEWKKSLGGSGFEEAQSIKQTADGGYIIAGYSTSNDGDVTVNNGSADYWIVKLDASENITWQKSHGGSGWDEVNSIQQTTDEGYIVAGFSDSNDGDITGNHGSGDYWVVKLDATGNITWQKSLGGSGVDIAHSIQQTTDGGYVVAGESTSVNGDITGNHGESDYWVVKLDATGNITWQTSLGGSGYEEAKSIKQTADGGYIVAGESDWNDGDVTGNNGFDDYWVVKLDGSGSLMWQRSLGGSERDRLYSIQQTNDEGYIVTGESTSSNGDITGNHGDSDFWVVKLDASGNIIWQNSLGGSNGEEAYSVQQTTDGGYVVAGISSSNDGDLTDDNGSSDYWVVKLDGSGNMAWEKSLGGYEGDGAYSIEQTTDGGYIVVGYSYSNDTDVTGSHGLNDFWVVKLSPETSSINEDEIFKLNTYPNPTTKTFTITSDMAINSSFKIIDAQGKEVLSGNMNGKEHTIDISSLSNGVYSVVFDNSELPVLSVIKE